MTKNSSITIGEIYTGITDGVIISDIELQRDIVYSNEQQALVIDSIFTGIPLPAFYFWENENGVLEVLDGKQRIEAIKKFRQNDLEYKGKLWKEIGRETPLMQNNFNSTELSVIICSGDESLKREIFRRINTLGVPLSAYEVLNGLYHGEYLEELSDFANQPSCSKVFGTNSRGKTQIHILKWLLILNGVTPNTTAISEFVKQRKDSSFSDDKDKILPYIKFIKDIFEDYSLIETYFPLSRKYIKDVTIWKNNKDTINKAIKNFKKSDDWKLISDKASELEDRIRAVVNNISVDPKRLFTEDDKTELLSKQTPEDEKYRCAICNQLFFDNELTVDHIKPWSKGGRTVISNAQLLCRACNSSKGNGK